MLAYLMTAAPALAHGPVAPTATKYLAQIVSVPPGLRAKIVDGYVRLWLSVPASTRVVVPDYVGAPYLRFTSRGVEVNENSTMYYLNLVPSGETPATDLRPTTPSDWHLVSSGHAYEWHDGRLQGLATVAALPGTRDLGVWRIPLLVNGHHTAISGRLIRAPAPPVVWFWPIAVMLIGVLAARRLPSAWLHRRLARWLASGALFGAGVAAVARGLHGRPNVGPPQLTEMILILLLAAWTLERTWRRDGTLPLHLLVSAIALWEGLNLLTSLTRPFVLLALPPLLVRIVTVVCLGSSVALLLLTMGLDEPTGSLPPDSREAESQEAKSQPASGVAAGVGPA